MLEDNFHIRAAVIGAGNIGSKFDSNALSDVKTHAGAYSKCCLNLVGICDVDEELVHSEAAKWGTRPFSSVDALLENARPNLVSICTPVDTRFELIEKIVQAPSVSVIVSEKPFARTAEEAEHLLSLCNTYDKKVLVNYSRRFSLSFQSLRELTAISATIKYSKGFINNGTHGIDFCRMLFGEFTGGRYLGENIDHYKDDPTVSAIMSFERCPNVFFQGLDSKHYTIFEIEIFTSSSRYIICNDSNLLTCSVAGLAPDLPVRKSLFHKTSTETDYKSSMLNLILNAVNVLNGAEEQCSAQDALEALRICDIIFEDKASKA